MYEGPEFRHLITFVAIAEECSFGKAAARLHTTQPALSNHIRQLEEGLNRSLFKRVPFGAELTQAGRDFLPYARQMLHMRTHAVSVTSRSQSDGYWPLRLGYSQFVNHALVAEGLKAYEQIVPEGRVNSSSGLTTQLIHMLNDGRLDAAIVTLPVDEPSLSEHFICQDRVLICLRCDDPAAAFVEIPKEVVAENLRMMFNRAYHPALYDRMMKTFTRSGILLHPTESYSTPSDMQFIVKNRKCFGLAREGIRLDSELTTRPIEGISFRITTALMCPKEQSRPVLPMLAYRMSQMYAEGSHTRMPKKSSGSVGTVLPAHSAKAG